MAKKPAHRGIFGPEAWRWRGSILRLELPGEKAFYARLREVGGDTAELEVLDPANLKGVIGERVLDWPPGGTVNVIRTAL